MEIIDPNERKLNYTDNSCKISKLYCLKKATDFVVSINSKKLMFMSIDYITQYIDIRTIIMILIPFSRIDLKIDVFFIILPFGNTEIIQKAKKGLSGNTEKSSILSFN